MGKPVNKTLRIAAMSAGEEIGHVSGPIVTFRGNGAPLRSLLVNIEPVQAGSGDPSPDNVRPISGWSAVNVWRTGKNLCSVSTLGNLAWVVDNKSLLAVVNSLKDGTYTVSFKSTLTSLNSGSESERWITGFIWTNSGGDFNHQIYTNAPHPVGTTVSGSRTLTIDSTTRGKFTHTYCYGAGNNVVGAIGTGTISEIQIELGSTATPYEPYQGDTYIIQLGQTVYGGTLDVTNGVLTAYRVCESKTWGELVSATDLGVNERRKFTLVNAPKYTLSDASDDLKCNIIGEYNIGYSLDAVHMYIANTEYAWVYLPDNTDSTTVVQLLFTLATPITIKLTPMQIISTLQGENAVWADSGDVDVEYIATGGEGGKLALLLRNRKELLIALRKGLTPAEAGLLNSTPLLGGFVRPGLSTDDEKEEDELI